MPSISKAPFSNEGEFGQRNHVVLVMPSISKALFSNCFPSTPWTTFSKPALLNFSGLRVFEKLRFRDGLVRMVKVGLTIEIKLVWTLPKYFGDFVSLHSLSSSQLFKWFRIKTGGFPRLSWWRFGFVVSGCIHAASLICVWFAEELPGEEWRIKINGWTV